MSYWFSESCLWAAGSGLSWFHPSFSMYLFWLSCLAIFCLPIGQSSFYYQPMRATYIHSVQKGDPTAQTCAAWFSHGSWCRHAKSFTYRAISPALRPLCDCVSAASSETLSLPYRLSMAFLTFVPVIAKVLAPLEGAGMLYICVCCCLLPFFCSCLHQNITLDLTDNWITIT